MKLIDRLHEKFALSSIGNGNDIPDVNKWKEFLDSLGEPKDCYDMAFNKYQCRMYYFHWYKKLMMNILGFFAIPVKLIYLIASNKKIDEKIKGEAIIEHSKAIPNYTDIFPYELYDEYKIKDVPNFDKRFGVLCREAKRFYWRSIRKHPFSFFFNYFVYMELAAHSYFLLSYNPEATIIYTNERNVASPIITELYEVNGRELISFMHGEYLLQLIQGYMGFSRYYIWNDSYEENFKWLRCRINKYCVYTPGKFKKKYDFSGLLPKYFCTYYVSGQSKTSMLNIAKIFTELNRNGKRCKLRPHPRNLLDVQATLSAFSDIELEDGHKVSLEDSLGNTEYVVGLNTTVLTEAYVEGKKVVIDDVSDSAKYEDNARRGKALSKGEFILFSELLRQNGIDCTFFLQGTNC